MTSLPVCSGSLVFFSVHCIRSLFDVSLVVLYTQLYLSLLWFNTVFWWNSIHWSIAQFYLAVLYCFSDCDLSWIPCNDMLCIQWYHLIFRFLFLVILFHIMFDCSCFLSLLSWSVIDLVSQSHFLSFILFYISCYLAEFECMKKLRHGL